MAEIVNKNPVNDPSLKGVHTRSTFDLGQSLANTERFGEITPRFALEVTSGDHLPYRFSHELRTYTFKAPHMGTIHRNEDAFFVPAECILPLNWDKLYTNPLLGDDVDASNVGCTVIGFTQKILSAFEGVANVAKQFLDEDNITSDQQVFSLEYALKFLLGLEMIYSNGSLPSTLGAHFSTLLRFNGISVDKYFDQFMNALKAAISYIKVEEGMNEFYVKFNENTSHMGKMMSLRQFLEIARDGFQSWHVTAISYKSPSSWSDLYDLFDELYAYTLIAGSDDDSGIDLSLARFFAYQICCAHFYTNDKIDYVYDANLYRQNIFDSIYNYRGTSVGSGFNNFPATFFMNGSTFEYDFCSAKYFNLVCDDVSIAVDDSSSIDAFLDYLRLIFGFNRSLRYVDYFTGSKSRPLAVGDVNVGVVSNQVNVVDVTRNIQRQRFLNAVNRVGRRISEYVKGIFGVSQAPDYHNPFFLSHTSDLVGAQEIENTGAAQLTEANSVTSIMRSNSSRFQFEFDGDRVGILIGVVWYDIERYYFKGVEKLMQHVDRYDMFNPFMQFTGDQPVDGSEIDVRDAGKIFSYQMKYAEYKQRYNQCSGGFVEFLPGWIFKADESENDSRSIWNSHISPSFIRSKPSELDPFYSSLTGYSLASYFHFIVINDNACEGSRPMAYAPSIL